MSDGEMCSVKWAAAEVLADGNFSHYSDVVGRVRGGVCGVKFVWWGLGGGGQVYEWWVWLGGQVYVGGRARGGVKCVVGGARAE